MSNLDECKHEALIIHADYPQVINRPADRADLSVWCEDCEKKVGQDAEEYLNDLNTQLAIEKAAVIRLRQELFASELGRENDRFIFTGQIESWKQQAERTGLKLEKIRIFMTTALDMLEPDYDPRARSLVALAKDMRRLVACWQKDEKEPQQCR